MLLSTVNNYYLVMIKQQFGLNCIEKFKGFHLMYSVL